MSTHRVYSAKDPDNFIEINYLPSTSRIILSDDSGNSTTFVGGANPIDGSGTANKVPKFTDANTLGDSPITVLGSDISLAGKLTAGGNIILGANYLSGDGGNEGISVDASGNVGIGTTSPGAQLEVKGNGTAGKILIGDMGYSDYGGISLNGSLGAAYNFLSRASDGNLLINRPTSSYILFLENNSSEQFVIKSGGNVGIGTTSPSSKLSVDGGVHIGGDSDAGDNNLLVDGNIKTGDPATGADVWLLGNFHAATLITVNTNEYIEVKIGSVVKYIPTLAITTP